jgi:hypothetical protein
MRDRLENWGIGLFVGWCVLWSGIWLALAAGAAYRLWWGF